MNFLETSYTLKLTSVIYALGDGNSLDLKSITPKI